MKIKELIAELQKFDLELEVKILSFHYPNEPLFHFTERSGIKVNVASGHLDKVGTVIETVDKNGNDKEIYVCDRGAFSTMISGEQIRKENREKISGK